MKAQTITPFPGTTVSGPATDSQIAFLMAGADRSRPRAHLEQIVAEAPAETLDPVRLRSAWLHLARENDSLRMVLEDDEDGRLILRVLAEPQLDLRLLDWSFAGAEEQQRLMAEFLEADRAEGLDPRQQPGWRVTRINLGAGRAAMLWTIQHAMTDGTSMEILLTRLWEDLVDRRRRAPPATSFAEVLQRKPALGREGAKAFFARMLEGHDRVAPLRPHQAGGTPRMRRLRAVVPAEAIAALDRQLAAMGATQLNAVQAAWAIVLGRWTGQPAACMGLVDAGRSVDASWAETAGCLISTLPFQVDLAARPSLRALLTDLRALTLEMRRHAHVELTEVRRWSGRHGAAPLFDTVVMYARRTLAEALEARGCGWTNLQLVEEGDALVTLSVHGGAQMRIELEHDAVRLTEDEAARMLGHVTRLLTAMGAADPDAPWAGLDMLSPDETEALLALGRPRDMGDDTLPCPATRFEQVAAAAPTQPAIIDAATGAVMDFRTLDQRANAQAQALADAGLGPEDVVGIALPRGADQIIAMLAVLKAGAAFLPLEPDQAADYLAKLLDAAGARALIAAPGAALAEGARLHLAPSEAQLPAPPPRPAPDAGRLAYVIFTSGSTGAPKAVMGLAGALAAHADAAIARFRLTPADRVLQFSALGFDVMLEEIFPTLLAGAAVVPRDARPLASVAGLLDLLAEHEVTVANLPASYWHQLVADLSDAPRPLPPSLRLVVTGSERVLPGPYLRWRQLAPGVAFMSGYGPTETTITCTIWEAPAEGHGLEHSGADIPIGRPLGHAHAVLRAPDGSLTPRGGQGALWIGGAAVTRGYMNDPGQTAAAFVQDPWSPGGRLYDSGDRARWNRQGELMFLGRGDRQLKLRGFRIDPAQIEAVLGEEPAISRVHVDVAGGPPPRLVAWVVARQPLDAARLSQEMLTRLPHYMQPQIVQVEQLPLTPNGKIDRAALPLPPSRTKALREAGAPQDERARLIAACMAEVLEVDEVPTDADFDELGGDSLLALRLVSLIQRRTGLTLRATDLARHPSPEALAAMLAAGKPQPRFLVPIQAEGTGVPVIAVHVLGRNQELYRPLAAVLAPDHPVYGLTVGYPRNLDEIDIPRIARGYFDELQRHLPDRPVCLVAVSMAAYFAFELAQQLRQAGREVALLGVMDATGPGGRPPLRGLPLLLAHLRELGRDGPRHLAQLWQRRREARAADQRPEPSPEPGLPSMEQVVEANVAAVEAYRPKPYDSPLTVYRADRSFWDSPAAKASALGWNVVAQGELTLRDLPGTHLSILEPGNVDALAIDLRRRLADLGPKAPRPAAGLPPDAGRG
ncbi:non-ribosomal peptide synthetase [Paracoccus tibetensis]|uniref:Amino acid adenylation domain-containing protein n=1 Tax=Paracoccus tibetensis TaxID=336292 RepID=A0A1G5GQ22_9RHOB|nr:non-ribosomal peptide synthetase [Paracoccus tibetensis]SCY53665.1 amino acid adenylation domain-containing protein [Paracoccus tibetensis]